MRLPRIAIVASLGSLVAVVAAMFLTADRPAALEPECRWLAGDLDVHTAYSVISVRPEMPLDQALTFSPDVAEQAALAEQRGLDFIAITDYLDVSAQSDADWGTGDLIWIPAYEHAFGGIAQLLGAKRLFPTDITRAGDVDRVFTELRGDGGVTQIAQPGDRSWPRAYGTRVEADAVQVWFNGPWAYDPGKVGKDGAASIRFYDRLLDSGHHVAATAGSNSLLRGISKLAGVGQPTTWVCAASPTTQGVLAGIARGRTSISHEYPEQRTAGEGEAAPSGDAARDGASASGTGRFRNVPPAGTIQPFVSIEADARGGQRFEALLGDTIAPGDQVRVGVFDAPFSVLRIVADGSRVLDQVDVYSPTFVHAFDAPEDVSWLRAEVYARPEDTVGGPCQLDPDVATYCGNRIGMLALTSAIYVGDPDDVGASPSADAWNFDGPFGVQAVMAE